MKIYQTNIKQINWFKYKKLKIGTNRRVIQLYKKNYNFLDNKNYNIIIKVEADVISHQPTWLQAILE